MQATLDQGPTSVNHAHTTQNGLELFKVTAVPIDDGGVLELHVPLDDVLARDKLTGLHSREFFERVVDRQLALLRRMDRPFAVIMLDLDHFKRINDEHGHAAGDAVLSAVGKALLSACREADTIGRWGGEEIAVFLPDSDGAGSIASANRLAEAIRKADTPVPVTASLGVCSAGSFCTLERALTLADEALYQAKAQGRDCIRSRHQVAKMPTSSES